MGKSAARMQKQERSQDGLCHKKGQAEKQNGRHTEVRHPFCNFVK